MKHLVSWMRDMAECRHVRPLLQSYLDDAVDESTRERVARHVAACRRCGREAKVYAEIKAALHRRGAGADPEAVRRLKVFASRLAEHGDVPDL